MQPEEERTEWIFPPPALMQDRGTQARRRHFSLWDARCDSVCRWAPIKRRHSLIHGLFFFANNGPGISNRAPKSCVFSCFSLIFIFYFFLQQVGVVGCAGKEKVRLFKFAQAVQILCSEVEFLRYLYFTWFFSFLLTKLHSLWFF